jgi:HEPN domain-containing protein
MPPERLHPGLPSEWLRHARSDIFFAQNRLEEGMLETNCYHAQQSVEKSIKAVCVHRNIRFSYTHDLNRLMTELYPDLEGMPFFTKDLEVLSGYAVSGRYPGFDDPVTEEEWQMAVRIAKTVLDWDTLEIRNTPE